jgi:quercetin dioxygenase-like cupin family protein
MGHDGEEFFHVLRGVVELTTDGSTRPRDVLKEGDSIHLEAHPGREVRNIGDGVARVLWAVAPPIRL